MPRPYADVVGQFRRGMAGGYAARGDYARAEATAQAVDPELANSYASMADRDRTRRRQQEAESANHTYAQALQGGDYEGAASVAAKIGDVEAMQGARTTQQQVTEQQRVAAWRELQGYASAIEGLAQSDNPQAGYEALIAQAAQESADSPELAAEIARLPRDYQTAQRVVPGVIRTWMNRLLTPQQLADYEMTERQRDIQARQADIAERRAAAAEQTAQAAMLRAERAGGAGGQQEFSRANSLRDEYNTLTSGYRTIADFAERSERYMQRIASNPRTASGQADVGLVYALAKIYDPTSVVREGEFATVAQQGGFGEQIRSYVNTALGRGFSPAIRNQIMTEIRNGVAAQRNQRDQTRARYVELSNRAGIDPGLVIDDYEPASAPPSASSSPGSLPPAAQRRAGQRYPMPDGGSAEWDGQRFINPRRPGE